MSTPTDHPPDPGAPDPNPFDPTLTIDGQVLP